MKKNSKTQKPKLSLCMIVKDEEEYLEECLESVHDVVDEIIVVDTGSEDKTVEIARKFRAEVYQIPWRDDFASARNECIKHANGDWILQLDADERLDPESKEELRKWIRNKSKMCASVIIDSPKEQQNKGHISRAHRLFRNVPGIRYSGRIHEQISPSIAELQGEEGFSNIKVVHLGYAKDEKAMQSKSDRNYQLLKKQISEEPTNAYWHFTFAQNLILRKEYEQALASLQTALRLGGLPKDIRCSIYNNLAEVKMALGRYPEAIQFAEKALSMTRYQTTSYLLLYAIYEHLNAPWKQIDCLEAAKDIVMKKSQAYNDVSLEAYVDPVAICTNLGNRYFKVKKIAAAQRNFQEALEIDSTNFLALRGLADCFLETEEFEKAADILEQLRKERPGDPVLLDKLAWVAIKLQTFDKAIDIYQQLHELYPQNSGIVKRLAALHSKIGNLQKSKEYLLKLKSEQSDSLPAC
ncbi:MAG: glycosyltransferase [bacterium]